MILAREQDLYFAVEIYDVIRLRALLLISEYAEEVCVFKHLMCINQYMDITDTVDFIVLKSDINEIIIFECSFLMFSLTLMNVIFRKLSTGVTEKVRLISLAIW